MTEQLPEDEIAQDEGHDSGAEADQDTPDFVRKREIVAYTAEQTGQSKADVRAILDAAFAFMRAELLEGKDLHYPTFGKVRIKYPNREGADPIFRVIPAKQDANALQAMEDGADSPDEAD
ncbi:HU family DNA-binding protein [Roseobacter sp. HKCCA0434]|uniref:HU family DNA-binding protein n=1 Tax=Roseobacter sp. HKCCA0434 TaxID=3079297 RepID=UPI00290597CB|nr:HU family DNA-binding protein [Roseobacter sp. HKCCA0434]